MTGLKLTPFLSFYVASWMTFCVMALVIAWMDRKSLWREYSSYLRFLTVPWKLWLFVPALLFVTFAGRFTNDETWDVVTGSGMAVLTFLTAPCVLGLVYRVFVGRRPGMPEELYRIAPDGTRIEFRP